LDSKILTNDRFDVVSRVLLVFRGSKMQTEVQTRPRVKVQNTGRTRFKPGQNYYTIKRDRIAAKLDELTAEYFPAGGMTVMDNNRLKLAAAHYIDAETCRDPVIRQRATRTAEYLLCKLSKPPSAPRSQAVADHASAALELLKQSPDGV
jgi:hypothetical protein